MNSRGCDICTQLLPPILEDIYHRYWNKNIIGAVLKNGDEKDPAAYCSVSLMCSPDKIFQGYLLFHLQTWISENNLLGKEQAIFREAIPAWTIHHLVLPYLVSNYVKRQYHLYVGKEEQFNSMDMTKLPRGPIPSNGQSVYVLSF